jgi:hypothetical protein
MTVSPHIINYNILQIMKYINCSRYEINNIIIYYRRHHINAESDSYVLSQNEMTNSLIHYMLRIHSVFL